MISYNQPLAVQEHLLPPLPVSLSDNDIPATIEDKVNALLAQVGLFSPL